MGRAGVRLTLAPGDRVQRHGKYKALQCSDPTLREQCRSSAAAPIGSQRGMFHDKTAAALSGQHLSHDALASLGSPLGFTQAQDERPFTAYHADLRVLKGSHRNAGDDPRRFHSAQFAQNREAMRRHRPTERWNTTARGARSQAKFDTRGNCCPRAHQLLRTGARFGTGQLAGYSATQGGSGAGGG